MFRLPQIFMVVCLLCVVHYVKAQNYPLRHFTSDIGLNSNVIYDAVQDDKGFIWFATSAGVVKYDGKYWKNYTLEEGISDNDILKIKKDGQGRLWLLAFNGTVTVIDNDSVYNNNNHPLLKKLGPGYFYRTFYVDDERTVWLSNMRNNFWKIKFPNQLSAQPIDHSVVFKTSVQDIIREQFRFPDSVCKKYPYLDEGIRSFPYNWTYYNDSLLVGICDSNIMFLTKNNQFFFYKVALPKYDGVVSIYCEEDLSVWITTEKNGVYRFAYQNNSYVSDGNFLNNEFVTSSFNDNENNIWFTTHGNGVYMLPSNYKSVLTFIPGDKTMANETHAVFVDHANRIWIGHKYEQITLIEKSKIKTINLNPKSNRLGRILKIEEHPDGLIVVSSDQGLYLIDKNLQIKPVLFLQNNKKYGVQTTIKDFFILENKDIYVVCLETLHRVSADNLSKGKVLADALDIPVKRLYTAFIDKQQQLWFSDFEGLFKKNKEGVFSLKAKYPLLSNRITDMCIANNKLVLSILGHGIVVMENELIVKHLREKDGLTSNHCGNLFQHNNKVYVCTNKGVNVIDCASPNYTIQQYTTADGLISNQINDVCVRDNVLYAATINGISALKMSSVTKKLDMPKLYFTNILWKGVDIRGKVNPTIDYVDKYLRFDFISPSFSFPEGVLYKYSLNNGEEIVTQNTSLEFNSLKPGDYLLQLQAKHLNTTWSAPILYHFNISQPFYQTWTFYTILLLFVILALIANNYFRIKRLREEQMLTLEYEQKINQLQIQTLQAMMNPHFIFNSLSAIQQQINLGDSNQAGKYLTMFSKLLRKNLETISENFITVEDELEKVTLYLESEKMRLGEKLCYRFEIDEHLNPACHLIPSMIIQPMIENAIWHGILPYTNQGLVILRIQLLNESIVIEIDDNGIGIGSSAVNANSQIKKSHFGIKITTERLSFLQKKIKKPFRIEIMDLSEVQKQGTKVQIILPIIES